MAEIKNILNLEDLFHPREILSLGEAYFIIVWCSILCEEINDPQFAHDWISSSSILSMGLSTIDKIGKEQSQNMSLTQKIKFKLSFSRVKSLVYEYLVEFEKRTNTIPYRSYAQVCLIVFATSIFTDTAIDDKRYDGLLNFFSDEKTSSKFLSGGLNWMIECHYNTIFDALRDLNKTFLENEFIEGSEKARSLQELHSCWKGFSQKYRMFPEAELSHQLLRDGDIKFG